MRSIVKLRVGTALLVLTANLALLQTPAQAVCGCQDLLVDVSTGIDATGATLPVGANDARWELVSGPSGATVGPAAVIQEHAVWTPTKGSAQWLNAATPAQNGLTPGGDVNTPGGTYLYAITFTANTTNQVGVALDLAYSADDGVDFYLNGTAAGNHIGGDPFVLGSPSWSRESLLNYAGPLLLNGPNTLYAEVENWILWTGFYVRGSVHGRCGDVATITVPIRTGVNGVDSTGPLMAQGTQDDDWRIASMPDPPGSGAAIAVIPSTGLSGAWTAAPTNSRWISREDSDEPQGLQGPFVYRDAVPIRCPQGPRVTLCLSADINLTYAADNSVDFTFTPFGGLPIPIGGATAPAFDTVNTLSATTVCSATGGLLEANVFNQGGYTGLWVEGSITFTLI